jgi:hypothetical protein
MAKLRSARAEESESEARLAATALNQRIAAFTRLAPTAQEGRFILSPGSVHDTASWCAHCAGNVPDPNTGP